MGFLNFFRRKSSSRRYYGYDSWDDYYERKERYEKNCLQNNVKPVKTATIPNEVAKENVKTEVEKVDVLKEKTETISTEKDDNKPVAIHVRDMKNMKDDIEVKEDSKKPNSFVFSRPIYREKKSIIIFAIENTAKVRDHKNEILRLTKKIVQDNSTSLFLFLRVGNNKKFFDILDSEEFEKEKIVDNLFLEDGTNETKVDFAEVLNHIDKFLSSLRAELGIYEYKEKKYDIENSSIIFVGTADYDGDNDSKKEILNLMSSIRANKKIKTIKYFCMEDKETINAAMLGFPVVGHIVSDFYK